MAFTFSMNITGVNELAQQLNLRGQALAEAKNVAVDTVAQHLRDTIVMFAQAGHPGHPEIDTGQLVDSIEWEHMGDAQAQVYTMLEYALYVEMGHAPSGWYAHMAGAVNVPPYPFFRPAVTQVEDGGEAWEIIKDTLEGAVQYGDGGGGTAESTVGMANIEDISVIAEF